MTKFQSIASAVLVTLGILALCIVSFIFGHDAGRRSLPAPSETRTDTLWRTDTHFVERPVERWVTVEKPVYIAVTDTQIVRITDSVFVVLQREIKGYSGDEWQAQVSGIDPALDWIRVYPKTAVVTNTETMRRKWSFGVTAGPGLLYDGMGLHGGIGIVAGLQYNF